MVALFSAPRKALAALAALAGLAACTPGTAPTASGPALQPGAPVQVALLLPSGQSGDEVLARALQQSAKLAVADLSGVQIDLRTYDTGPTPAGAAAAATKAADEGAKVILGPVYADAANAAGHAVAARGINVLSFSNNAAIAGGNVFVLGPTFQNTATRLVKFAKKNGKSRIHIVHERTQAGEIGRAAIAGAIANSGAALAGTTGFEFSQAGVTAAIPAIVAGGKAADAIFLTSDAAGALPMLAQSLPAAGLSPAETRAIGLTRWDVPAATLSLPGLQGGWFALPDPTLQAQFAARYQAAYGAAPHPIAGLAYDGIAAIGSLARSGKGLSAAALTQGAGFAGTSGIFRFLPGGVNQRGLAVAEVRNGQMVVVDPAPRSFGGFGL